MTAKRLEVLQLIKTRSDLESEMRTNWMNISDDDIILKKAEHEELCIDIERANARYEKMLMMKKF